MDSVRGVFAMKPRDRGWVYFMTDGTEIKVGWSGDVERRRYRVQQDRGKPVTIITKFPGTEMDESVLKAVLAGFRTSGEWHQDDPYVRDVMALLHKWRRFILGRSVTIRDVIEERTGEALRRKPLMRIMPCEYDGYAAWYAANRGKLPTPEIERQAYFCRLDLDLLRREGRLEIVRRIVAASFAKLAEMMGRVSVVTG